MTSHPSIILQIIAFGALLYTLKLVGTIFGNRNAPKHLISTLFWSIFWFLISTVAFFPFLALRITQSLGFGNNLNTLIFIGFVSMFVTLYKTISMILSLQRRINSLVSEIAVRDSSNKK